ncbi:MAG: radical SAM protein [Bacillota bacterium]|nr:radical SAM protein [Bacillota bacterium]
MRLAFLAPAGAMHRHDGSFGHSLHYAPLTLTTLAALVPENFEHEAVIYDETVGPIPLDLEADLILMTAITGTAARVYAYADYFRARGIPVVLGGVHPTLMPDEAQQHADAVVTGFAEQIFGQLLEDARAGQLQPRYSQQPGFTMAGRPIPRRELLSRRGYITKNTVEAIRGCQLPCTFCAYPAAFGRQVYRRPVEEVVAEIAALNARVVVFPDVNLIADRSYALKLFRAIEPLKVSWLGLATSHVGFDAELVSCFARSGCRGLLIGMESVNQASQSFINKGVNQVTNYYELMQILHDNGILVQGCFAFGGDEDDPGVFDRTVELCIKAKIDLPRYSILTPFPNTAYYRQLESEGRIIDRAWPMYDVEHCVFRPRQMTPEELEAGTFRAWREVYRYRSVHDRLKPYRLAPWLSLPLNMGYKGYADRIERFTRSVMCDNSDIPVP